MGRTIKRFIPPIFIDIIKYYKHKIVYKPETKWHLIVNGPLEGKEILADVTNRYFSQMIQGKYDDYLYKSIDNLNLKGQVVIDVGCHIGYHSLGFSNMVGENGQVYAIDPNPYNLKRLIKNVERNSIENIFIKNVALSDCIGEAQFEFSSNVDDMTSSGGFIKGTDTPLKDSEYKKAGFVNKKIEVTKLDNLISKKNYNEVALLKVDVEGHEANVLKGGRDLIKNALPIILIEIHTIKAMYEVSELMQDIGYNSEILFKEADGRLFLKYYKT